jgi:hypothetical protein
VKAGVAPTRPRVAPTVPTQNVGAGEIPKVFPPKVRLPVVVGKR